LLLTVFIDERQIAVDTPPGMMVEAEEFFAKMDADMDQGWQMGRQWIESPNPRQRCQIAADKLMSAEEAGNQTMMQLMAAYILSRMPGVAGVNINTGGEMEETEFAMHPVGGSL